MNQSTQPVSSWSSFIPLAEDEPPSSSSSSCSWAPEPPAGIDIDRLARHHGDALYRRAVRFVRDPAEAWDLLQDCYERAMRAGPVGLTENQAMAWVQTVMRNLCLDRFRARNRHPEIELDQPDGVPNPEPEDEPLWSQLTLDEIRTCVARLTEPLRNVYELYALEGLSYAEISSRLQLPPNTVGTRLLRARQKLRQALCEAQIGDS